MVDVLDGALIVRVEAHTRGVGPGTFLGVPPGVPHAFANLSDTPVRFPDVNTPAGWEGHMRDLGAAAARPQTTSIASPNE